MIKIGLTGGIAAGKSTVCELFSQLDIPIIDADIIARQLVEPGQIALSEIIATFGIEILNKEGSLDRSKLRQLIFSDPSAKQQLEQILHPKIRSELKRQSDRVKKADYCILAIPLLIETQWQNSVNRILVVDIDQQAQIERLCSRDQIAISEAEKIIKSQSSADQRLSYADDVIENNLSADFLKEQVLSLDSKYRLMANKQSTTCQSLNSQRQY